jgi:hypothetical protein
LLALGAFFSEKYRPNDLGYFLSKNSQILTRNFFGKKFLFIKAPFWAIFRQNWAHSFIKRLVTLLIGHCDQLKAQARPGLGFWARPAGLTFLFI